MILPTSFVLLATSLVASSSPLTPRTPAQVEADINALISSVNSLDGSIKDLSSVGFVGIGAVETDTQTVLKDIQTAITDATATGPLDVTDGEAVLELVEQLQTDIITTLNDLVAQEANIEEFNTLLPGTLTLVKDDLNELAGNSTTLENILLENAPTQLKPSASAIIANVNSAFSSAIAAYATAT